LPFIQSTKNDEDKILHFETAIEAPHDHSLMFGECPFG